MKELRYARQFKKDLKRFLKQPKKLEELKIVLDMLRNEITQLTLPYTNRSSVATLFQRNFIIEQ